MVDRTCFTVVFEGDISKLPFNPLMKDDTPFGRVISSGYGNAFSEADELTEVLTEAQEVLAMMVHPQSIHNTTVMGAYAAAVAAEAKARRVLTPKGA